jgi:hypothetical protein
VRCEGQNYFSFLIFHHFPFLIFHRKKPPSGQERRGRQEKQNELSALFFELCSLIRLECNGWKEGKERHQVQRTKFQARFPLGDLCVLGDLAVSFQ